VQELQAGRSQYAHDWRVWLGIKAAAAVFEELNALLIVIG
jgi:hypothetical protein